MNFKIMTFNVRRLNGTDSIKIFRNYIKRTPQFDMLCIQEHKVRLLDVGNLRRYLWLASKAYICNASLGYNKRDNEEGAGCGGIAILIAKKWTKETSEYGTIMRNRA